MKKFKKVLSLLLALCMVTAILPVASYAADSVTYKVKYTGEQTYALAGSANGAVLAIQGGSFGKLNTDSVYKYNPASSHSGLMYLNMNGEKNKEVVYEFSFLLENTSAFLGVQAVFTSDANANVSIDRLIKFSATGGVEINYAEKPSALVNNGEKTKLLNSLSVGEWHTVAIKAPSHEGEDIFKLYVDGAEAEIPFSTDYYGSNYIRLYGTGEKLVDNVMSYKAEYTDDYKKYSVSPVLTAADNNVSVSGKEITLNYDMTASQLEKSLSGATNVRVYTDATYQTQISGSEKIQAGYKVVAAAKNGDNIERAYSYYTVSVPSYTEDGLLDGKSELALKGASNGNSTITYNVDGVFGKSTSDKVYKIDLKGDCNVGAHYLQSAPSTTNTSTFELSLAMSEKLAFRLATAVYSASDKSSSVQHEFLDITDGTVKTRSIDALADDSKNKTLCTINTGEWINIAVVVPGYTTEGKATKTVYVYINGQEYPVTFANDIYGVYYHRFALAQNLGEVTKTYYYDNIRTYNASTAVYNSNKDKKPVIDFGNLKVSNGHITIDEGTTVADFKAKLSTTAEIRVFDDNTYTNELSDEDYIGNDCVAVFAAKNFYTTERTYSYYTLSEATYEENDLRSGEKALTASPKLLYNGDGNTEPAVVTTVGGIFGKKAEDLAYKFDVKTGGTGWNYIGSNSITLDTRTMEISVALTKDSPDLVLSAGLLKAAATNASLSTGELLHIRYNTVVTGDHPALATKNQKLCDIADNEWVTLAFVIEGYNQKNGSAENILVYVNGTEYKLPLSTDIFGTSYLRFAPSRSYDEVKTVYYDNIRIYDGSTEVYDISKDKQPTVGLGDLDVFDGNINIGEGITVEIFEAFLDTRADVRVYKSDLYTEELSDSDEMSGGNMVVFATRNSRTTERTYTYYTINRPLAVEHITLTNADGKMISGSQMDLENVGETYWLETTIINKTEDASATLKAVAVSYDASGKMVDYVEKEVIAKPGTTVINADTNQVFFEDVVTPKGGTLKAFLWVEENQEPLCRAFEAEFSGREEYHVINFGNSYGVDSFTYLPAIGKAAGVDIYAVNMYTGGCKITQHYKNMKGIGKYESRLEYLPNGDVIETRSASSLDGITTYGYSWDFVSLQGASHGGTIGDMAFIDYAEWQDDNSGSATGTPGITTGEIYEEFKAFVDEYAPNAQKIMHMAWTTCNEISGQMFEGRYANDESPRQSFFDANKAAYEYASNIYADKQSMMVPTAWAVWYALNKLGFKEHSGVANANGTYNAPVDGEISIYRDEVCHLTDKYGRVLAGLTWYEYITGKDARENPYQREGVSEDVMAKLKEAAHWANQQVVSAE